MAEGREQMCVDSFCSGSRGGPLHASLLTHLPRPLPRKPRSPRPLLWRKREKAEGQRKGCEKGARESVAAPAPSAFSQEARPAVTPLSAQHPLHEVFSAHKSPWILFYAYPLRKRGARSPTCPPNPRPKPPRPAPAPAAPIPGRSGGPSTAAGASASAMAVFDMRQGLGRRGWAKTRKCGLVAAQKEHDVHSGTDSASPSPHASCCSRTFPMKRECQYSSCVFK